MQKTKHGKETESREESYKIAFIHLRVNIRSCKRTYEFFDNLLVLHAKGNDIETTASETHEQTISFHYEYFPKEDSRPSGNYCAGMEQEHFNVSNETQNKKKPTKIFSCVKLLIKNVTRIH